MIYEREANLADIQFKGDVDKELFGDIAESWAKEIAQSEEKQDNQGKANVNGTTVKNKYTKVRAFYDDIEKLYTQSQRWTEKDAEKAQKHFDTKIMPYLGMMKSKVSYAKSRNLITSDFERFTKRCISEVESKKGLETCKLFFESFIGFYRGMAPK